MTDRSAGLVTPAPPVVQSELLHIGNGLRLLENPTGFLTELRAQYGDTFLLDVFGYQLFCTFSGPGLASLYRLPEEDASFGLATYDLIGFKTPLEVFLDASKDLFYELLTVQRVNGYLKDIAEIADAEFARLGQSGEFEIFDRIRTLEQRMGYRLWAGTEASSERYWQRFKQHFDVLDQERAFVNPTAILATIKNDKKEERAAVAAVRELLDEIWAERLSLGVVRDDTLNFLHQRFATTSDDATRLRKVAHNVINANQGFLSNLYAAIAWCIVHLVTDAALLKRARAEISSTKNRYGADYYCNAEALNEMIFLEQLMMESVRVAQRSITLRKVLKPVQFDVGGQVFTVQPGVYITTLLSVTNCQTPELQTFDPQHYEKNRLAPSLPVPGRETVSTFGHGKHACPAQRFSHQVNKIVLGKLLERFDLQARFAEALPSPVQLGGVARSAQPCVVAYQLSRPR